MPAIFNLADFLKIGIMAFVFVYVANRVLDRTGLGAFKA